MEAVMTKTVGQTKNSKNTLYSLPLPAITKTMFKKQLHKFFLPAFGALFLLALASCDHAMIPESVFLLGQPDDAVIMKGTIETLADIPQGIRRGWAYYVNEKGAWYVWTGSDWEPLTADGSGTVPPPATVLWLGSYGVFGHPVNLSDIIPDQSANYAMWEKNMVYFNSFNQTAYIATVAAADGTAPSWEPMFNYNPAAFIWKGQFTDMDYLCTTLQISDTNPVRAGWVYFNMTDGKTYLCTESGTPYNSPVYSGYWQPI